jgi:hypothetical protein
MYVLIVWIVWIRDAFYLGTLLLKPRETSIFCSG